MSLRPKVRRLIQPVIDWSEARPRTAGVSSATFWSREIRVPTKLIGALMVLVFYGTILSEVGIGWRPALGVALLLGLVIYLAVFYLHRDYPGIFDSHRTLALLGTLASGFVLVMAGLRQLDASPYLVPVAAAGMLVTILVHPRLALLMVFALALFLGVVYAIDFYGFLVAFFGGAAAVAATLNVTTRRDITRAGLIVSGVNMLCVAALRLVDAQPLGELLPDVGWGLLNGFLSTTIVLALLPYLEHAFHVTTRVRLVELADFRHPLLRRLMMEAPGTYHHSLMLSNLAERAAESIGADSLLCRVGAYFHDVGKLVRPEAFQENQAHFNAPDALTPGLSSLLITAHVKEGIRLAEEEGLPEEIVRFIPMHHGTSLIHHFYLKALEEYQSEHVEEAKYRYPGPKPQSRETAIVMLADACEAASRTLDDPAPGRIAEMVSRIINNKFIDGQLDEANVTLKDLRAIADSFTATLGTALRHRIRYPEAAFA